MAALLQRSPGSLGVGLGLALALGLALGGGACFIEPAPPASFRFECSSDSECEATERCAQGLCQQPCGGERAGDIKLHLEGRRRQHERGERGRVVVRPHRGHDCADTMRYDRHPLARHAVRRGEVIRDRLQIPHVGHEARRMSASSRRLTVAARFPREDRRVRQREVRHHGVPAVGVLVPAMQEHERPGESARRLP